MVEFSLFNPTGDFEEVADATVRAEAAGFDGVLFGEHHGSPQMRFPQLLLLLAGLAARTKRIKLGTSILLSPLYDPVNLAESAAVVDTISGGRLILGLGLGYQPQDFQHFGIPFGERASRFEEGLEVLRRAWTEERFSFEGRRYRYTDVSVYPKPIQRPHPPVWLAAWSDAGARRAGRLGDAFVTDPIQDLGAIRRFVGVYRESADASGRAPRVVLMREFLCAPTRSEAEDRYAAGLVATYRYYWANGGFNAETEPWVNEIQSADEITFERMVKDRVIFGSPEDCAGQLEHWIAQTGAEHVQVAIPGTPDIEMVASSVIARLR